MVTYFIRQLARRNDPSNNEPTNEVAALGLCVHRITCTSVDRGEIVSPLPPDIDRFGNGPKKKKQSKITQCGPSVGRMVHIAS